MQHVTETIADNIEDVPEDFRTEKAKPNALPGPSTNPATNLLIADIALRGIGRIMRNSVQKSVLRTRYDRRKAAEAIENRSIVTTLAIYGVTKFATRSIPGAALVAGGLLAKTVYDRSRSRVEAKRAGDQLVNQFAEEKSEEK
ncbi:hypothetical protein ACRAQ6_00955 [Erythrobacter sp. HA6-11]